MRVKPGKPFQNIYTFNAKLLAILITLGMAKAKKTTRPKKKRAHKYYEKLAIDGTFEEVIKQSVAGDPVPKPNKKKK